jgi:hypothetical protein
MFLNDSLYHFECPGLESLNGPVGQLAVCRDILQHNYLDDFAPHGWQGRGAYNLWYNCFWGTPRRLRSADDVNDLGGPIEG